MGAIQGADPRHTPGAPAPAPIATSTRVPAFCKQVGATATAATATERAAKGMAAATAETAEAMGVLRKERPRRSRGTHQISDSTESCGVRVAFWPGVGCGDSVTVSRIHAGPGKQQMGFSSSAKGTRSSVIPWLQ